MSQTDQMLARYVGEIEDRQQFIDGLVEAAQNEKRDLKPEELDVEGRTLVGDGAVRYRDVFEARGATVPDDDDPAHRPNPLLLVERATTDIDPLYVRDPDAKPSRP